MYYNTKIQTFSPTKYNLNTFELGELELTGMDAQGHTVFLSRPFFHSVLLCTFACTPHAFTDIRFPPFQSGFSGSRGDRQTVENVQI